jgi:hypothetical protein
MDNLPMRLEEVVDRNLKFDRVIQSLKFCPTCGKELDIHPATGQLACFLHGEFEVVEEQAGIRVTYNDRGWK